MYPVMTCRSIRFLVGVLLPAALLAIVGRHAAADPLTLTPAGIADGFTLSTFVTLNPGENALGPFGVAVASNGNVIVGNNPGANNDYYSQGTRYVFTDVDGQTTVSALNAITPGGVGHQAYASVGGEAYGAVNRQLVEFNPDGTVNHVLTGVTTLMANGMWGNPVNGHIIAISDDGVIDINPLANGGAGSFRVINSLATGNSISVSPDGKTGYIGLSDIVAINLATGIETYVAAVPYAEGIGTIYSHNDLNGDLVVDTDHQGVYLVDPTTGTATLIASGGSRGVYVGLDPTNGSLFIDQSDGIDRLSWVAGPTVPEPSTLGLMGGAFALGLGLLARVRKLVN
jgi:hypothetical protein